MESSLYFQGVGENLIIPIFRWQNTSVFLMRFFLVLSPMKYMKLLSWLQWELLFLYPLPFLEAFSGFRYITITFYIKNFVVIIIILICRTLRLSIIIPFINFELSSSKKLVKEGINKKSSIFEKFLELLFLLGFLWILILNFKLLVLICWSLFLLLFCKN